MDLELFLIEFEEYLKKNTNVIGFYTIAFLIIFLHEYYMMIL